MPAVKNYTWKNPGTEGKIPTVKNLQENSCSQSSHKKDSWVGKSYREKFFQSKIFIGKKFLQPKNFTKLISVAKNFQKKIPEGENSTGKKTRSLV